MEQELTEMQKFFMTSLAQVSSVLDINIVSEEQKLLKQLIEPIEASLKMVLNAKKGQVTQYAHCFCEISQ